MTADAVDLFAGPGGWDVAAGHMGVRSQGIEWDDSACLTRAAANHETVQADVALLDPRDYPSTGQIASPPCQGFSLAGKGAGREDSIALLQELEVAHTADDINRIIEHLSVKMTDARTLLVLEPLRWALTNKPMWLAWEQVPLVQPIWDACALVLQANGYSVDTRVLTAEQYGVPQTRRRSVLVARNRAMTGTLGPAKLPTPTHSKYHNRTPERLDAGVPKWVSMAEAMGWGMTRRPYFTVAAGTASGGADPAMIGGSGARKALNEARDSGDWALWQDTDLVGFPRKADDRGGVVEIDGVDYRARDLRSADQPSFVVTEKARSWTRFTHMGDVVQAHGAVRHIETPAPALTSSMDNGNFRWVTDDRVNNQSGEPYDVTEQINQPASTIAGRDLVAFRGANANRFNGSKKSRNDGIRVTVAEAGVLQSFPDAYPWQGTKTQQFQQVGNAIPPLMALAILRSVTGL